MTRASCEPHLGRMAVSDSMEERSVQAYKEVPEVNHQVKREVVRLSHIGLAPAVTLYPYVLVPK